MPFIPRSVPPAVFRPTVEVLEDRDLPSSLLVVQPGNSKAFQTIQGAVNAAASGDQIEIFSGTYQEAVQVSTPKLKLFGAPGARVVISNPGSADNGITIAEPDGSALDGFSLSNVTVSGFAQNGVYLQNVVGFSLRGVTAVNNGDYGLFPVLSSKGDIANCTASGSNDTGIYVGESANVTVHNCVTFNNVNGIEIENCTSCQALYNNVFGNTVGILEDLLPGLTVETAEANVIMGNVVTANNRPNTAPANDPASLEPPGTGIAVFGGDRTLVKGNVATGNAFTGIALLSGVDLLGSYPPGLDPNPENTLVAGNVVLGNGFVQQTFPQPADLFWDGSGMNNHWRDNVFGTSNPSPLP
jgi:parallel beta-helix repeat protein